MGILDLIFDNIYVVIVVLFAVFKVLGSFSRNKKPTSMPTFGGDQQYDRDDDVEVAEQPATSSPYQRDTAQQARDQESVQSSQLARAAMERASQQSRPAATPSYEETRREQQRRQELAKQRIAAAQRLAAAPSRSSQLGKKDLREAVIWSEILGQPRAKRPFRR